jgi:hypothetical protein
VQLVNNFRPIAKKARDRYRRWSLDRRIPPKPVDAIVPLEEASDVLLLCSRCVEYFDPKAYLQELAFAHELAARGRKFAVTDDPSAVFDKSVAWVLPNGLVSPPLWDYSRQVWEFAAGLERQGNRLFCSAHETRFWENKAEMHRSFDELGIPAPATRIVTAQNAGSVDFDLAPVLVKEEHSAGSAGIHYFATAAAAREFILAHPFRPTESLIVQEIVPGATKDLRLTMVGDRMIESASFWRLKSSEAAASANWTTTATKYNSTVEHANIPPAAVRLLADYLRRIGLRIAGADLMWVDDDVSRDPLVLEVSPYFQPNPRKPERYVGWPYKKYKQKAAFAKDGYLVQQYLVFRDIAAEILDQNLF